MLTIDMNCLNCGSEILCRGCSTQKETIVVWILGLIPHHADAFKVA